MIKEIRKKLFQLKDDKYKEFHYKLLNCNTNLIGVRTPELKRIAKQISKENYKDYFLEVTNEYYEETMIEGFIIGFLKEDVETIISYVQRFLPKIDNWAICDMFVANLKIINKKEKEDGKDIYKNKQLFYKLALKYLKSDREFEKRFAIVLFLTYYLTDEYIDDVLEEVKKVSKQIYNKNLYYVDMAIAWLLSVSYIKYKEKTIKILNSNVLNSFTHNKTISKICDSYRINKEEKEEIKKLKRRT